MFDESFLFDTFEEKSSNSNQKKSEGKKSRKRKRSTSNHSENGEDEHHVKEEEYSKEQLQDLEEKLSSKDRLIQDLEKQNEKLKAAMKRLCGLQIMKKEQSESPESDFEQQQQPIAILLLPRNPLACHYHSTICEFIKSLPIDQNDLNEAFEARIEDPQQSSVPIRAFACNQRGGRYHAPKSKSDYFHIINATQFYIDHCLDRTGQPLNTNSTSQTNNWDVPPYEQVYFNSIPKTEGSNVRAAKTPSKAACFNCGNFEHNLQDCTEPRDQVKINDNRKAFIEKRGTPFIKRSRYHVSDYQDHDKFKPGIISDALKDALGMGERDLPPYIYKMRVMGYPPGYSTPGDDALLMFDQDEEGEVNPSPEPTHVDYPGFNYPLPSDCIDRYREFNAPPYNPELTKEPLKNFKRFEINHDDIQSKNAADRMDIDELEATPVIHTKDVNPPGIENDSDVNASFQFIDQPSKNSTTLEAAEITKLDVMDSGDLNGEANQVVTPRTDQETENICRHREWWVRDLTLTSTLKDNTVVNYLPPPTCKYNVRMEDIPGNMITYPELIRDPTESDLLYPLYGNLSTSTGVYDNIRTRLRNRKSITRSRLSL